MVSNNSVNKNTVSKKRMALFMAASVVLYISANCAHPVTPTIFQSLGLGDYMFGYALASMMIVNFFFSPFWGKLNTIISTRTSLLISCFGYALGQLFFGLARTELQFIGARMFAGLFTGGTFVSTLNYIVNVSPEEDRGTYLTMSATIQSVAGAFGFFVGGMLGEISVSFAIIAQVVGLASSGVLFYFICVSDKQVSAQPVTFQEMARGANPFAAFFEIRRFMTAVLISFFAMCALHALSQTAFDQSFNYYLKDQFNFSSGYNGAIKAVMGIITLIANSTVCIYLVRKTDIKKSVIGLFGLSAALMLVIIFTEVMIPFLVLNVLFYALCSISLPLLQGIAATSSSEEDRNLIMGVFNSMKSLGGIMGAIIAGTFYSMNPKNPFIFAFGGFLIATLAAIYFYKKSSAEQARPVAAKDPAEALDA